MTTTGDGRAASKLSGVLALPGSPASITGIRGTDDTAILTALLTALDALGLISDDTTAP